jgi:hypothetical protein
MVVVERNLTSNSLRPGRNLEDQGVDYDQYSESGWMKAEELFTGKVDCDSSRVYLGTNRRRATDKD